MIFQRGMVIKFYLIINFNNKIKLDNNIKILLISIKSKILLLCKILNKLIIFRQNKMNRFIKEIKKSGTLIKFWKKTKKIIWLF